MAHTRQDILNAKQAYFSAADRLLSILAGEMQAIENAKRAVGMMEASDEPLDLPEQVETLRRRSTIKDLADKMTQVLADASAWERLRGGAPKPLSREDAARQHLAFYQSLIEELSRGQTVGSAAAQPHEQRGTA